MNKRGLPITEYVERGAGECPYCSSNDIEVGLPVDLRSIVRVPMKCDVCLESWWANYTLLSYDSMTDFEEI